MFASQTVTRSQSVPSCSFGLLIPNVKFLVLFWFISFLISNFSQRISAILTCGVNWQWSLWFLLYLLLTVKVANPPISLLTGGEGPLPSARRIPYCPCGSGSRGRRRGRTHQVSAAFPPLLTQSLERQFLGRSRQGASEDCAGESSGGPMCRGVCCPQSGNTVDPATV